MTTSFSRPEIAIRGKMPSALSAPRIRKIIRAVLDDIGKQGGEIGVAFAPPGKIADMNFSFRGVEGPTDVLSFTYATCGPVSGDIVICPSYAARNAKEREISSKEELTRLLIHGVLHLAGYDHATDRQEKRMFGIQERIVNSV
jgi:probable rRNA maturation factor